MTRTIFLAALILALVVAGCSSGEIPSQEAGDPSAGASLSAETTPAPPASGYLETGYEDALSLRNQLALGALRLEGTAQEVAPEQAQSLLVFWQAYAALSESSMTATEELTALENQIVQAMTLDQLEAIAAMQLTNADMTAFYVELGVEVPAPAPGVTPQGGQASANSMSEEERDALRATAEAQGTQVGTGGSSAGQGNRTVLVDALTELLTSRAVE